MRSSVGNTESLAQVQDSGSKAFLFPNQQQASEEWVHVKPLGMTSGMEPS